MPEQVERWRSSLAERNDRVDLAITDPQARVCLSEIVLNEIDFEIRNANFLIGMPGAERFASIQAARAWCRKFFDWYNHQHYHSGIGYLRPADLHEGRHHEILEKRQAVLDQAQAEHPERFQKRPTPANPPKKAWINRPTLQTS